MELDSRYWSIFMFATITAFFLAAICTPYQIKGLTVSFGEVGLWKVDYNSTTPMGVAAAHFEATQVFLCLAAASVALTFIGYILLCRVVTWFTQLVTVLPQILAGCLTIVAIGFFASVDPVRGEGWWMATMAGAMYILNGIVILIMPCLDSEQLKYPSRAVYIS